ncbi:PREDICTED: cytochrome b-c1 complex subunit 8 [Eufriesea mexicana]|uniref:cytochrome b-c1 complex subunit 8 n=1 Tax=Eufriesea mexicana TaxID=516756 RepID=UPI00083BD66A|nr:PREDICTED: cytochrome b-c1 complex subunit 8 [Eufriesea mexicana]
MGLDFGNLARISGITFFRLSPHEQRAFAGMNDLGVGLMKGFRKNFLRIAPMFMISFIIMNWAHEENRKLYRKNPKDYENDV